MRFGIFDHMECRSTSLEQLYAERLDMLEFANAAGFLCYHKQSTQRSASCTDKLNILFTYTAAGPGEPDETNAHQARKPRQTFSIRMLGLAAGV